MGNFFKRILSNNGKTADSSSIENKTELSPVAFSTGVYSDIIKLIKLDDLRYLLSLLKSIFVEKNKLLDSIYPVGIVIELKNDVNPNTTISEDWQDITSKYTGLPSDIKKWQRIIVVNSNKTQLQENYNKYKDLRQTDYTEASWAKFATALATAKEVLDNPSATQDVVDKANTDLITAYVMLRKKQ